MKDLAYSILKGLSHSRNRLMEHQIRRRTLDTAYRPRKGSLALDAFSGRVDWRGKRVLDVGCGNGDLSIWLASNGARSVVGVDADRCRIETAMLNRDRAGLEDRVRFECAEFVREFDGRGFDIVISIAAFEHILDPLECLRKMHACLRPGGFVATRFGPLWWSPYGAHMTGFTRVPWVHVLFPERTVLRVRRERYRPDQDAERYEDIDGNLNRISKAQFKAHARQAGFEVEAFRLNPEKDARWGGALRPLNTLLNWLPGINELFAFSLLAVLRKPARAAVPATRPRVPQVIPRPFREESAARAALPLKKTRSAFE